MYKLIKSNGDRDVIISTNSGEGNETTASSDQKSNIASPRTKPIYPPFESHYHLPPHEESKASPPTKPGFKSVLSYPFKFRNSIKKLGRSKSMEAVLEGTVDPKDEKLVQAFRELLFLEGQLPGKHNNYHTLLRYVSYIYIL